MINLPTEIWSRILDHVPLNAVRSLCTANRDLHQTVDLSAYLFKNQNFIFLIRINPNYPSLHRYLAEYMKQDQTNSMTVIGQHPMSRKKNRRDPLLFRSLKTALLCGYWPLIELLTPAIHTRKTQLILMGIVFDAFTPATVSSQKIRCRNLKKEDCEKLIEHFLSCWISSKDQLRLFWHLMRQAFLWNAQQAIDSCLKWLNSKQQTGIALNDAFFMFLDQQDPAMRRALLAKEKVQNALIDSDLRRMESETSKIIPSNHSLCQNTQKSENHPIAPEIQANSNRTEWSDARSENIYIDQFPDDESDSMVSVNSSNFIFSEMEEPKQCRNSFENAVQKAAINGEDAVFKLLTNEHEIPTERKMFALRLAATNGYVRVLKWLLMDPQVDPSAFENAAIRNAAENGHLEVVNLLLSDARVDPSSSQNQAIRFAVMFGYVDVVRVLLTDSRVDPSACKNEAIRKAVHKDNLDIVKLLLANPRVNPAACKNEAIRSASENGNVEIVKLLLRDPRVSPASCLGEAFYNYVRTAHFDIFKLFLADSRVTADERNFVFQSAVWMGHLDIVRLLHADSQVDPAARENAAIKNAAECGYLELVKLLLDDPRVNPADEYGGNALHHALRRGHLEIARLLLADPRLNSAMCLNQALCVASAEGHLDMVIFLLDDSRVDPTTSHNAPIRCAAQNGHLDIVKLLLTDSRVDPAACNNAVVRSVARHSHLVDMPSILILLLSDDRIDQSCATNQIFFDAVYESNISTVRMLINDPHLNFNSRHCELFHVALWKNQELILHLLRDRTRDIVPEWIFNYWRDLENHSHSS